MTSLINSFIKEKIFFWGNKMFEINIVKLFELKKKINYLKTHKEIFLKSKFQLVWLKKTIPSNIT